MRRAWRASLLLLASLAAAGCSLGKGTEGFSKENFATNWKITRCEYVGQANPAQKVELVAQGWAITLYVNDNGMFRYSTTPPGGSETFIDGTWTTTGETVTLTPNGSTWGWTFRGSVGEESLTMAGASAEWDLNGDAKGEAASWSLAGQR
jgi:hypothetical protein